MGIDSLHSVRRIGQIEEALAYIIRLARTQSWEIFADHW